MPSAVDYGSLSFAQQIEFFRRKVALPTQAWTDLVHEAHDHAFVVAGANRDDLVRDFQAAVDRAIADGVTLDEFRKDFDRIVAKYGWSYNGGRNWRSRVIYETNLRTSYGAGRWNQLQAVKAARPFWQYVHSDAVMHPRPLHEAWNGLVIHADDPWWRTHYPPNGWGCQCTVRALNARDLQRLGRTGPDPAPEIRLQTVTIGARGPTPRVLDVPEGIDPGFGYTPGRDAWMRQQVARITAEVDAEAASQAVWEPTVLTTAADVQRPALVPLAPLPVPLGERVTSVEDTVQAMRAVLGADLRFFDVKGLPTIIDAEWVGSHLDPSRAEFLPLLVNVLEDPFEIWLQLERERASGKTRIRARIIKAFDVGKGRGIVVVAEQRQGILVGWTIIPTRTLGYLQNQRQGALYYGAAE